MNSVAAKNKKSNSKNDVVTRAKKRFQLASDAESEIRKEAREDFKFRSGDQWPEDVKYARSLQKRPCLTVNQLPMFLRQVINDQRQNRPSIKINAVSDDATIETAKVLEGLVRHIEYSSNADIAYDTASDGQCTGGFGFLRVITEYCDPESFDQDIRIIPVKDPMTIRLDPFYTKPDGSDTNYGFAFEVMSEESFKEQWPNSELSQMDDWTSLGDGVGDWVTEDGCRVADYYEKTFKTLKIYLLSSGDVFTDETLPEELPDGVQIVSERETKKPLITHYKINGIDVLEESEFPCSFIPIIPVLGGEIIVDGKRILEGVIRHAKDSQRMYNYWATASAEMIALAPKAPFVGAAGQFEGHERKWQSANSENHAFLEYNQVDLNGRPAPPPQRQQYEPPIQAITQERGLASNDLRSTTGIMDAALGQRSNEVSGAAIQRRNTQAQVSNFHFADNFSRSLKHVGRIILELIPKIYDAQRTIRIIHEDGQQEVVAINNALGLDPQTGKEIPNHDFSVGEYDVTVSTGPSYQTKRQEAAAEMLEMVRAYPPTMQVAPDLVVSKFDWPGAQELAERFRKTLPPGLVDNKDEPPIPPQVQQQMMQMKSAMTQMQGQLAAAENIIQTKMIETAAKERIANMQVKADIEKTLAEMNANSAETLLEHQVAQIDRRQEQLLIQSQNPTGGESPGASTGAQSPGQNLGSNP